MVWHVQHHTAKTRSLDCYLRLLHSGETLALESLGLLNAEHLSEYPNNVLLGWMESVIPKMWLTFALKIQMTDFLLCLPWDIGADKVLWKKGYWVYRNLLLCSWYLSDSKVCMVGSPMSLHHGLFTCSWVYTRDYNQICQLQRYLRRGLLRVTCHSLQLSSKHLG